MTEKDNIIDLTAIKKDEQLKENIDQDLNAANEEPKEDAETSDKAIIVTLETELKNAKEQYLRSLADLENYRKRAAREREDYLKFANLNLVKKIIPIVDDLERALLLSQEKENFEAFYKGVEMILKGFTEAIKSEGVETISAEKGKAFDPEYHEALMIESCDDYDNNVVIETLQKGYLINGRIIRPCLVKVSG